MPLFRSRKLDWSVGETDLDDRFRSGGQWALDGFEYQTAYAVHRLSQLVTCEGGLVRVRFDAAQDIDLLFAGGRQRYVQAKNLSGETFDWAKAKGILMRFLRDMVSAHRRNRTDNLTFELSVTAIPVGDKTSELLRGNKLEDKAREIAALLDAQLRGDLDQQTVETLAERMLRATTIEVAPRDEATGIFSRLAELNLIRFGIPVQRAGAALDRMTAALKPGKEYTPATVLDLVGDELPQDHPAARGGHLRMLRLGNAQQSPELESAFLAGGQAAWEAVEAGLDVLRDSYTDLFQRLADARSGRVEIISGAGGAGKSILARRVAWDLQATGKVIAVEVVKAEADDDWSGLVDLAHALRRPILVLIDDVYRSPAAIEQINRLDRDTPVLVLATSRPGEGQTSQFRENDHRIVIETPLDTITDAEISEILREAGSVSIAPAELEKIRRTGQIFLLMVVLHSGSMLDFARGLVAPFRDKPEYAAYLDLCLSGRHDQTVPKQVLIRRHPAVPHVDRSRALRGLVFQPYGGRLRSGHALLAEAVIEDSGINQVRRGLDLIEVVDEESGAERRYAIRLLQTSASDGAMALAHAKEIETAANRLAWHAGYVDLMRLADVLNRLGRTTAAAHLRGLIAADRIGTGQDAAAYLAQTGWPGAFSALLDFYGHSDTSYGRRNFIARCAHGIDMADRMRVIEQTRDWLQRHRYPPAETKSALDVLEHSPAQLARAFAGFVYEVLRGSDPATDILRVTISVIWKRLQDDDYVRAALDSHPSLLVPMHLADHPVLAAALTKMGQNTSNADLRKRVFDLLWNAMKVGRLDQHKEFKIALKALSTAPDDELEERRMEALALAGDLGAGQETLDALANLRRGQP